MNAVGNSPLHPQKKVIDKATRERIERLLLERILLAGIARAVQVSEQWLQTYVNQKYTRIATQRTSHAQKKGRLTIQCDELWSFVENKGNKQSVWLALDANTREIVGVYIRARDEAAAQGLWDSLPAVYRGAGVAPPPVNVRLLTLISQLRFCRSSTKQETEVQ